MRHHEYDAIGCTCNDVTNAETPAEADAVCRELPARSLGPTEMESAHQSTGVDFGGCDDASLKDFVSGRPVVSNVSTQELLSQSPPVHASLFTLNPFSAATAPFSTVALQDSVILLPHELQTKMLAS